MGLTFCALEHFFYFTAAYYFFSFFTVVVADNTVVTHTSLTSSPSPGAFRFARSFFLSICQAISSFITSDYSSFLFWCSFCYCVVLLSNDATLCHKRLDWMTYCSFDFVLQSWRVWFTQHTSRFGLRRKQSNINCWTTWNGINNVKLDRYVS